MDQDQSNRRVDSRAEGDGRFAIVARRTLPEEIAERLLALIRSQELRPGDKLPAERTLAAMMEVSRPVLREALRALAIMKVVEIRQGTGTYITSLEPRQMISHVDLIFSKDTVALVQLLEARRVVEIGNVRLAALRVTQPQLDELAVMLADLASAVDDAARFSDLDIAFHNAVCGAAGNFLLSQFMSIITTLGRVSRERTGGMASVRHATLHDHASILDALRARDPDAAADSMREHLDHVEQALEAAGATASIESAESGGSVDSASIVPTARPVA